MPRYAKESSSTLTLELRNNIYILRRRINRIKMMEEERNTFTNVTWYKRPEPYMTPREEYYKNFPKLWDQDELSQEPKWEGTIAAFGATHGAAHRDELERKMAAYGGIKKDKLEIIEMAKSVGMDWLGEYVEKPKLDCPHLGGSKHVPFVEILKRFMKEYPQCKPMYIQKETDPTEVKPRSKWEPLRGSILSKEMDVGSVTNKNQQGARAMEVLELILYGGAAGTDTSGRSLVGLQMQMPKGGPGLLDVRKLSDTLEIESKGAYSHTHGPDWWLRVQMVFVENKEDARGVDKIYRNIPYLWVDMEIVRHGQTGTALPGAVWRGIKEKLLNYILQ